MFCSKEGPCLGSGWKPNYIYHYSKYTIMMPFVPLKYLLVELMRKWYIGHLMWRVDSLEKTLMLGGIGGRRRRGWTTEDEMAGWHHWLDGRESGWTPGVGDGQGGLACCDSWGCKESDTTEWLNWTTFISKKFLIKRQMRQVKSSNFTVSASLS